MKIKQSKDVEKDQHVFLFEREREHNLQVYKCFHTISILMTCSLVFTLLTLWLSTHLIMSGLWSLNQASIKQIKVNVHMLNIVVIHNCELFNGLNLSHTDTHLI